MRGRSGEKEDDDEDDDEDEDDDDEYGREGEEDVEDEEVGEDDEGCDEEEDEEDEEGEEDDDEDEDDEEEDKWGEEGSSDDDGGSVVDVSDPLDGARLVPFLPVGGRTLLGEVVGREVLLLCLLLCLLGLSVVLRGLFGGSGGCCCVIGFGCVDDCVFGCSGGAVGCWGGCDGGLAKDAREDGDLSESRKSFIRPSKIGSLAWKRSSAETLSKSETPAISGQSSTE